MTARSMRWGLALGSVAFAAGCGPAHLGEYTPKHRDYKLPAEGKGTDEPSSPGSLWRDGRPASMLFTDARALHANDLVVINIEEVANATRSADTNLARSSSSSAKIDAFLGLLKKLKVSSSDSGFNIGGSSASALTSQGSSDRSESLTATVPAEPAWEERWGRLLLAAHTGRGKMLEKMMDELPEDRRGRILAWLKEDQGTGAGVGR